MQTHERKQKPSFYAFEGSLYRSDGSIIEDPAMLIDGDILLYLGEYARLNAKLQTLQTIDVSCFMDLRLIRFQKGDTDNSLTTSDLAYIFRRAMEFTATGFVQNLSDHWGRADFLPWLRHEEIRIPLEVEWTPFDAF